MHTKDVGTRIQQIRNCYGLSQKDFSNEIGMSQGNYSKIESGALEPTDTLILAITCRFGGNPEWIKTGHGIMLLSAKEYLSRGIEMLGADEISNGLAEILKDPRFSEFQSYIAIDNLINKNGSGDLKDFLQQILKLWQQGDERTKQILVRFVRILTEVGEDK